MNYELRGQNGKTDFIMEIFTNRGMSIEQAISYLKTDDRYINSYKDLEHMDMAVDTVRKHIELNSKFLLIVDPDVDGVSASALFINAMKEMSDIDIEYVLHKGKQHGLSSDIEVDYEKYNIVIVPDAGSNDIDAHKLLHDKGIDVVVLDHHEVEVGYSDYAVVVNSQLSEDYENKMLSGVGIVWQFVRAYNDKYNCGIDPNYYLDLVGLGNVADMMSLRSFETKHLMVKGFAKINNPMFKAFVKKQDFSMKGKVNPMTVGWYIGPLINAMIRVGTMEEKELMFKAFLEENKDVELPSTKRGAKFGDMENLCEHVARICTNVRSRQNKLVEKGMALIESIIVKEKLEDNKVLIIEIPQGEIEPELIGLVANKITNIKQKPVSIVRNVNGTLLGSIRNFGDSPIEDFKGLLIESGLINWCQGK